MCAVALDESMYQLGELGMVNMMRCDGIIVGASLSKMWWTSSDGNKNVR